jgi:hypothetical protein
MESFLSVSAKRASSSRNLASRGSSPANEGSLEGGGEGLWHHAALITDMQIPAHTEATRSQYTAGEARVCRFLEPALVATIPVLPPVF